MIKDSISSFFSRLAGFVILSFILFPIITACGCQALNSEPEVSELVQREISRLEEEVDKNPENLDKRVELAAMYSEAGLEKPAIEQLEAVLEIEEKYPDALVLLGYLYLEQERYKDALEPYAIFIELNEDNPMRHMNRQLEGVYYFTGVAYYHLDRYTEAVEALEQALFIDRTDADAWYMHGLACQGQKEYRKAIESYVQATRFVPDFKEAYEGLADCYTKTGDNNLALYAEAMAFYSEGSYAEAIDRLEEVVANDATFAEAYLGLGLAYENTGEIDRAASAYETALHLQPDLWLAQAKLEVINSTAK